MDATTSNEATQSEGTQVETATLNIPNPDKFHNSTEMRFGFRTVKDDKTGVETKREAVEIKLPVLNFEGIVHILQNYAQTKGNLESEDAEAKAAAVSAKKQYDLLTSSIQSTYESSIKDFLGDNADVTSANFPYEKFTWEALANEPESERRGRGIAKEVWDAFIESYRKQMPALTGKKQENIDKQSAILAQKFNPLKNHEDKEKILPNFKQALTVYMNGASDAEQFAPCIQFLIEKADKILAADKNANLAENLGFGD